MRLPTCNKCCYIGFLRENFVGVISVEEGALMRNLISCIFGIVVAMALGGCANVPNSSSAGDSGSSLATSGKDAATQVAASKLSEKVAINDAIAKADAAYKTNQADKANTLLKEVAVAYPSDKMPWLRMAQAKFDSGNYSEAIVNAQEVLSRDAKDQVAKSIVVVSGLRLSTKALADLRSQNEISGSLRTEAQDLAKILRDSLGESALVAGHHKQTTHKKLNQQTEAKTSPTQSVKPVAVKSTSSANPFGALK